MHIHPYYFSPIKRVSDIFLAITLLILLFPLLLAISLIILFTVGRPIIFTQKRLGIKKQPFTIYKFRVMYVGAEKNQKKYLHLNVAPKPMYKSWEDPRFVGIGKWLSKAGIDELPQLWNILKGEMSFIGPRPLPIGEAKQLDESWNFRYLVRPGILSEWAISTQRHKSLESWKSLERDGLQQGGLKSSIQLGFTTVRKIFF